MPTGREFTVYGNQDCQVLHISFNTHFILFYLFIYLFILNIFIGV